MFLLALWVQLGQTCPSLSGAEGTCCLCWLAVFLVYCQLVSAFPSYSLLKLLGLGAYFRVGFRPPSVITLKLVSRGFVVKILHLRGVALVLSQIMTSSADLFCPQQPHLSLCRSRPREMGRAGAESADLIPLVTHQLDCTPQHTPWRFFFDSSVRAMCLLD